MGCEMFEFEKVAEMDLAGSCVQRMLMDADLSVQGAPSELPHIACPNRGSRIRASMVLLHPRYQLIALTTRPVD
jgi:hypothetical protein